MSKFSKNKRGKEIDDFLSQFDSLEDSSNNDIYDTISTNDYSYKGSNEDVDKILSDFEPDYYNTDFNNPIPTPSTNEEYLAKHDDSNKQKKGRKSKEKTPFRVSNIKGFKGFLINLQHKLFLKKNPNYDPSKPEVYQENGKKVKNKKYIISSKKIIRDCVVGGGALCIAFFTYALIIISLAPKINADDIYRSVSQSSHIYDDEGKEIDSVFYTEDRQLIKYEQAPKNLVNAFVAIEDKTFWKHHGFNWIRIFGAVLQSFTSGSISGTSTITQQLARNVYLADIKSVRSISRKIMEMYYTSQIEQCLDKEEIITAYMNTIYLGFGCYGVDSAARAYFSKGVKDLTLEECAALAALPQAPETYALVKYMEPGEVTDKDTNIIMREPDTYVANDISKDRRNLTLDLMLKQKMITEKEYKAAYDKPLIQFVKPSVSATTNNFTYFHDYLVEQVIDDLMEKYDYEYEEAETLVYSRGLKIYSTIDTQAQNTIIKEFNDEDNFPGLRYSNKDENGNIIGANDTILAYNYHYFFDDNGNFVLKPEEVKINKDGSITIIRGKRLNIYTTTVAGKEDYSLEFKNTYLDEETFYNIAGGYINIPADYKYLNKQDNLVISKEFFDDYPDLIVKNEDGTVTITQNAYSLPEKAIQPQAAMTIVEVGTGKIKAMVGGRKLNGHRLFNRATSPRQPGSSIKPLAVYGAALQKSFDLAAEKKKWSYIKTGWDEQGTEGWGDYITVASTVMDEKMNVGGREWPTNSTGGYSGKNTFRTAIQQSINTCAVKIQAQVGAEYSATLLKKFGLSTIITDTGAESNDMNTAALALGGLTKGAIPLEMALAYATFANGGVHQTSIVYTKVTDRNGKTLLTSKSKGTKVLDEGVAWIMNDVLQTVVSRGIAGPASVVNVRSGGKTGTTNNNHDIWFDGFTPTYAASLWIGTDINIGLTSMSYPAALLWGRIMRQIPKACKGSYKGKPANVISVNGEYFTKGTETGLVDYVELQKKKQEAAEAEAKRKAEEEAKKHGHWETKRVLVHKKGDVKTYDIDGVTPIEWYDEDVYEEIEVWVPGTEDIDPASGT